MRPNQSTGLKTTGNLQGESGQMTIHTENMAFIQKILIDLYSDRELAVIREYATNAFDAHVDAKQTRPIEVTTPNAMYPYYTIKDYGVGMSVDDVRDIYTSYGASTKRDSDEVVGMLGLGSKSGLTYAKQFTVVAIKNGVQVTVLISRKDTGEGVFNIIDTRATDEPNGTTIQIPVKDRNEFRSKAEHFFSFWEPGTVLVNGEAPLSFIDKRGGREIKDKIYVFDDRNAYSTTSYIVMGNVPYQVDNYQKYLGHEVAQFFRGQGFVAYVPIGSVNFTPSREDLDYTPLTEAKVKEIGTVVTDGYLESIQKDIDTRTTYHGAWAAKAEWQNRAPRAFLDKVTYKGEAFPKDKPDWEGSRWSPHAARFSVKQIRKDSWSHIGQLMNATFITGQNGETLSATMKRKIKQHFSAQNKHVPTYIYLGDPYKHKWIDDTVTVLKWDDMKAITLIPVGGANAAWNAGRVKGSWDFYTYDKANNPGGLSEFHEGKILPNNNAPVYWADSSDFRDRSYRDKPIQARTALTLMGEDATLVVVPGNRKDKFLRENPTVKKFKDHALEKVKELVKNTDMNYVLVDNIDYWYADRLKAIATLHLKVDDPDLAAHIDLVKNYHGKPKPADWNAANRLANAAQVDLPGINEEEYDDILDERYPLFDEQYLQHSVRYINMIYKENV